MKPKNFDFCKMRRCLPHVLSVLLLTVCTAFIMQYAVTQNGRRSSVETPNAGITDAAPDPISTAKQDAYEAVVLGSAFACGYDADALSGYLGISADTPIFSYRRLEHAKALLRFAAAHGQPQAVFLTVSLSDLFAIPRPTALLRAAKMPKEEALSCDDIHAFDDMERIGDLTTYRSEHAENFTPMNAMQPLSVAKPLQILEDIRAFCQEREIELILVLSPEYAFPHTPAVAAFKAALAAQGPYWDFTENAICNDPRFFYTANECRKAVGNMVLARIFEDETVYVPDGFGVYVTPENLPPLSGFQPTDTGVETIHVPILLYHHVTVEPGYGDSVISAARLEEHFTALRDAGYQTVSLKQLEDYVLRGTPLPENPICITFDDGYLSNYKLAFPLLEKYDMKAAIFVIGWAVGKDLYKETGTPMIPHFDFEQARQMLESGRVEIQSHTYDMHQSEQLEGEENSRTSVLPLKEEKTDSYVQSLRDDFRKFTEQSEEQLGIKTEYLSYPHGLYSPLSEKIFAECGIKITMSTDYCGKNTLIKGLPQSLRALYRFTVSESYDGEALVSMIRAFYS